MIADASASAATLQKENTTQNADAEGMAAAAVSAAEGTGATAGDGSKPCPATAGRSGDESDPREVVENIRRDRLIAGAGTRTISFVTSSLHLLAYTFGHLEVHTCTSELNSSHVVRR